MTAVNTIQCQHSPRSASGSRPSHFLVPFGIVCEASRTCSWHFLEAPTFSQWDPAPCAATFLSCRSSFDVRAVKNHFVLTQLLAIPLQESFLRCGRKPNRTTRTGSPCAQSRRREWLSAARGFQLLARSGVHIKIVRRNPPVTDDHNLPINSVVSASAIDKMGVAFKWCPSFK